jgi:hypothetical protein
MALDLEIYTTMLNIPNLTVEKIDFTERELNTYFKVEKNGRALSPLPKRGYF